MEIYIPIIANRRDSKSLEMFYFLKGIFIFAIFSMLCTFHQFFSIFIIHLSIFKRFIKDLILNFDETNIRLQFTNVIEHGNLRLTNFKCLKMILIIFVNLENYDKLFFILLVISDRNVLLTGVWNLVEN